MRSSRAITTLIGACVTAVAAVLIAVLPLAHAGAASTKGMGGGASSSQSGNSKSGHDKAPSPGNRGGEAHQLKPRPGTSSPNSNSPSPSSPGSPGAQPSKPAAPKKPSTPRRSPAKPDRDPHKYSPKTKAPNNKAPNTSDHAGRSGNKRKGSDRPSGPSENRGPNKTAPKTFAHPDSSPDRSSHGRPGESGRTGERTPDRDDPPATPLDSPGMDGVDNDHDGIVDNENPFVELPPVEIPMPRGGGFPLPGMKPPAPKAPAEPAPAPAPKAPESAPARPTQPPAAQKPAPAPAKLRPWQQGAPRPPQVPEGYVAGPARNGKGVVWRPPGSQGDENSIRIMEPTPQHPNGYVRYYNKYGQPVDQQLKPTGPDMTHHDFGPDGQFPSVPSGWPQK
ncbi:hypothetical protein G3I13_20320 [Streptomyces sp. SID6673]|nr:hypothetical protein [Streptomyces sp. SID11726]NEB26685.1 hypothetical protein [Streptomyces sp. SID6673]